MRLYLDNCVFNRPFDDQSQERIRKDTEAIEKIRHQLEEGSFELIWSYVIDLEAARNPFAARRKGIEAWKRLSVTQIGPAVRIVSKAVDLRRLGIRDLDSLHLSCAIEGNADYFITTDDAILKRADLVQALAIAEPAGLLKVARNDE